MHNWVIRSPLIVTSLQLESWLGSLNRTANPRWQHRVLINSAPRHDRKSNPAGYPWAEWLCDSMLFTRDGARNLRACGYHPPIYCQTANPKKQESTLLDIPDHQYLRPLQ